MSGEIKVVAGIRRREGASQRELFEQWERVHGPALAAAAKPLRYTVTLFEERPGRTPPAYDGIEELWFPDRAAYERGMGKDAPRVQGDEAFNAMLDPDRCFRLLASEIVPVEGVTTRENEKVVLFVKRADGVPPERFFNDWRGYHSANVAAGFRPSDGALRYAVWFADQGERGAYDGFPVFWWRDAAARTAPRDAATSGSGAASDDGFDALCQAGTLRLIGHEFVVVG